MSVRAIETYAAGVLCRSRLEARWLYFLREIGWNAEYEPLDLDGYIPGFLVMGEAPFLIEVKPAASIAECIELGGHAIHVVESANRELLVAGISPFIHAPAAIGFEGGTQAPGALIEYATSGEERRAWPATAEWVTCATCGHVALYHNESGLRCYPCGHRSERNLHIAPNRERLTLAWTAACNEARWATWKRR